MATVPFSDTAAAGQAKNPACAAFACAVLGFQVFPLVAGTKRPALTGWQGAATSSLEQIEYWYSGEFQDASVGIATGERSDLFVLDIDVKQGIDGFKSLAKICRSYSAMAREIPQTLTVATPSGGAHLYFRWAEGVVNSSGEIGEGLDVRGLGGLVHAPGWGGYQIVPRNGIRGVHIAETPAWLVELCRKQPKRPVNADGSENGPNGGPGVLGKERTLDLLGAAPRGTRNNALNQASFRLALRGEMTRDEAWAECRLVMYSIGASDTEAEQLKTFESGWRSGVAKRGTEA